ncbi:hypothetical protein BASA60_010235 [Batrachochytrium salamandrivorans]|nr:hypothetical protein BASA60_010235 [Batrachochytrium salamandrivorans]
MQPKKPLTTLATRMTIGMTGVSLSTVLASKRLRTNGLSFKSNGGQSKTLWFSMCTDTWVRLQKKRSYAVEQIVFLTLDLQALCVVRATTLSSRGYLGIVNNDLLTVFNKICLLLDTQFTELNTKMELEKSTLAHRHSLNFMKSLVKKISKYALDKMLEQYKKLVDMG